MTEKLLITRQIGTGKIEVPEGYALRDWYVTSENGKIIYHFLWELPLTFHVTLGDLEK